MIKRCGLTFIAGLFFCFAQIANANTVQCSVTVNKDPQWANYDVIVTMLDYATKNPVLTFDLQAADEANNKPSINTTSQNFNCEAHTLFQFTSHYTPVIWSTNLGRVYLSNNVYDISQQLDQTKRALVQASSQTTSQLTITVNFPQDFAEVPQLIESNN